MIETADKGPVVLHSFTDPRAEENHNGPEGAGADVSGFLDIGRLPDVPAAKSATLIPIPGHADPSDKDEGGAAVTNGLNALHLVPSVGTEATTEGEKDLSAPMLIATVVVDEYSHMREARRTASRLEALARNVQDDWKRQNDNQGEGEAHEEG